MMFYDYMKGLHQEKSLENLTQHWGKHAPSRTQVFFCICEFRQGRRDVDDECRGGTPATAVTVTIIEAAETLIRAEPRIQESLSIGTAATMSVLHDHLRVVIQRCARCIPHSLTDEQRRGRVGW